MERGTLSGLLISNICLCRLDAVTKPPPIPTPPPLPPPPSPAPAGPRLAWRYWRRAWASQSNRGPDPPPPQHTHTKKPLRPKQGPSTGLPGTQCPERSSGLEQLRAGAWMLMLDHAQAQ
jgi:hypothetical protein